MDWLTDPPWILGFGLDFGPCVGLVSVASALNTCLEEKNKEFSFLWWEIYGCCRHSIGKSASFILSRVKNISGFKETWKILRLQWCSFLLLNSGFFQQGIKLGSFLSQAKKFIKHLVAPATHTCVSVVQQGLCTLT